MGKRFFITWTKRNKRSTNKSSKKLIHLICEFCINKEGLFEFDKRQPFYIPFKDLKILEDPFNKPSDLFSIKSFNKKFSTKNQNRILIQKWLIEYL